MEMDVYRESDRTVGDWVNEESDGDWSLTIHKMSSLKTCVYFLRSQTELFDHKLQTADTWCIAGDRSN